MYSVVIIDDEPLIARGIEKSCNWNQYGAYVDLVSSDAQVALEYIMQNNPDIVFTDINMGDISGIDLMKTARLNGNTSQFVVISGYDDFEYIQNAMKYSAFYYLLKPIDRSELDNIMSNLVMTIKSKNKLDFPFEVIENLLTNTKISTHVKLFNINNQEIKYTGFQTLIVKTDIIHYSLIEMLDNCNYIVLTIGNGKRVYFVNTNKDLTNQIFKIKTDSFLLGISNFYSQDISPYKTYTEADIAINNIFIYKDKNIFKYKLPHINIFNIVKSCINNLNSLENILSLAGSFTSFIRNNKLSILEVTLLYNYLSNSIQYFNFTNLMSSQFEHKTYNEIIAEYKDIDNLSHFLYDFVDNSFRINKKISHNSDKDIFDKILSYIHANYLETIYLSDIAHKFYYNQNYISELIKRKLGKTFTDYILELRIKKACFLLINESDSISQVANKCGYSDYCYFTKQFKKITGKTPRIYRKESL
ncbi:response regulator [Clostridiaceae bacterium M8S5]|nr:response regulator [Clostridiaceae bacterium M8S5]